jgi:hypothetical protein
MALDASGDEPIDLFLDRGEGTLKAAFVLIDVIDAVHMTVPDTAMGR